MTISECSKQDIVTLLDYPPEQIFVAYCGIADHFRLLPQREVLTQFKSNYQLPEEFILYVGGYYSPRKNIPRLLDAYKLLVQDLPFSCPPLVLAGVTNEVHHQHLMALAKHRKLIPHVRLLPYLPDKELPLLYRAASLFVYPPLYEGFGLPVAEALACGAVVCTSNCSSLPEIGGQACLYFDPYDIHALAETVYEGLSNTTIRQQLHAKGPQHAAQFSWEQAAQTHLSMYQRVGSSL